MTQLPDEKQTNSNFISSEYNLQFNIQQLFNYLLLGVCGFNICYYDLVLVRLTENLWFPLDFLICFTVQLFTNALQ